MAQARHRMLGVHSVDPKAALIHGEGGRVPNQNLTRLEPVAGLEIFLRDISGFSLNAASI